MFDYIFVLKLVSIEEEKLNEYENSNGGGLFIAKFEFHPF